MTQVRGPVPRAALRATRGRMPEEVTEALQAQGEQTTPEEVTKALQAQGGQTTPERRRRMRSCPAMDPPAMAGFSGTLGVPPLLSLFATISRLPRWEVRRIRRCGESSPATPIPR